MCQLDEASEKLARWVASGQYGELDMHGCTLDAEVLRCLLLGLPVCGVDGQERIVPVYGPGVRLRHAVIAGDLNLTNGHGPENTPMPPLVLEFCTIPNRMVLIAARLQHLSLAHSHITHLAARGMHVYGSLDLSGLSSADSPDSPTGAQKNGLCWVELQECTIDGRLEADHAVFSAPPRREVDELNHCPERYALNLQHAHIRDSLFLYSNVRAVGGVSIRSAEIGGDVQCSGAEFIAEEGLAFSAIGARVEGRLLLRAQAERRKGGKVERFVARGNVSVCGAIVGSSFTLDGALIEGGLDAANIEIGGDVSFDVGTPLPAGSSVPYFFEAHGEVNLRGASIKRSLNIKGAKLDAGLNATSMQVAQQVSLIDYTNKPTSDEAQDEYEKRSKGAIYREAIRDMVVFWSPPKDRKVEGVCYPLRAGKGLSFVNAKIAGTLCVRLHECDYDQSHSKRGDRPYFDLRGVTVACLDDRDGRGFGSRFFLRLGDFSYGHIRAQNRHAYVIALRNVRMCVCWACIVLLAGVALKIYLQEDHDGVSGTVLFLLLFELVAYLALVEFLSRRVERLIIYCRRAWLNAQYRRGKPDEREYCPESYENLARALRSAGYFHEERGIVREKIKLSHRFGVGFFQRKVLRAFGIMFDYGLSAARAITTFCLFLVVGIIGVHFAIHGNYVRQFHFSKSEIVIAGVRVPEAVPLPVFDPVMVVNQAAVTSAVAEIGGGSVMPAVPRLTKSGSETDEIPCGQQVDERLYALDLFVPSLDLGQVERCSVSSLSHAGFWRVLYTFYAVLGWIVTALTILTVSGVLKRYSVS